MVYRMPGHKEEGRWEGERAACYSERERGERNGRGEYRVR